MIKNDFYFNEYFINVYTDLFIPFTQGSFEKYLHPCEEKVMSVPDSASTETSDSEEVGEMNLPSTSSPADVTDLKPETSNSNVVFDSDPGTWKDSYMPTNERDLIVLKGPPSNPNHFPRDSTGRKIHF